MYIKKRAYSMGYAMWAAIQLYTGNLFSDMFRCSAVLIYHRKMTGRPTDGLGDRPSAFHTDHNADCELDWWRSSLRRLGRRHQSVLAVFYTTKHCILFACDYVLSFQQLYQHQQQASKSPLV